MGDQDTTEASREKNYVKYFSETARRVGKLPIRHAAIKSNWILRIRQLTTHQLLFANSRWTIFTADQNGHISPVPEALSDLTNEQVEDTLVGALSLDHKKITSIRADLISPISEVVLSTPYKNPASVLNNPVFIACLNFAESNLQPVHRNPTFAPADKKPVHILASQDPHDGLEDSSSSSNDESE